MKKFLPINVQLHTILSKAYEPCPEYNDNCREMPWNPNLGHVPRGFCGALGTLEEVRLILVFAEPGNPNLNEAHSGIESAFHHAYKCFETGKDLFHRNVRWILDRCFPNEPFEKQMCRVWLTNSVLCSAKKEGGHVSSCVECACVQRYLRRQLALFPEALVVALGGKAQHRLRGINYVPAFAVAPPGCNKSQAKDSWLRIAELIKGRS